MDLPLNQVICGECPGALSAFPENSIDSIVTDPPYGLSFMGADWDHGVPGVHFWEAALRVAKPGAHLLAFGGTRTFHRLACAIEDAGWEIRDCIMWVYGSGFPKSLDVSKAIDKAAGAERQVVGSGRGRTGPASQPRGGSVHSDDSYQWPGDYDITAPSTDAAKQWQGWGTALKPAWEPIVVARKPLEGTVAQNVLKWGVGALNVDGCRIGTETITQHGRKETWSGSMSGKNYAQEAGTNPHQGRWPANVCHDGSEEVVRLFPQTGKSTGGINTHGHNGVMRMGRTSGQGANAGVLGDSGSAARFFYCAKASRSERTCKGAVENKHPTVKPVELMRYLCRLVTPPGGIVLDPFCGSGSTCIAAKLEGLWYVGVDKEGVWAATARKRLAETRVA